MADDNKNIVDQETRKKANRYFFGKIGVNLLLIFLGAVFIAIFLRQMQSQTALTKQRENSELALTEAVKVLEENAENADTLTRIFHDSNQDVLDDMCQLFSSGLFVSMADMDNKTRSAVFGDMLQRSGVEYLFLMSMDGKIVLSQEPSIYGENPAARALMTQENVNDILKGTLQSDGTIKPVIVGNQYGRFYFYSMPYIYNGVKYMFVLGSNASVLDVQIASLKDVSVVLSRASVGNNGFMFAVNKEDRTFLYFNNDGEILTGQSATGAGLTEAALTDGYYGIETINGTRYFCVSRDFGEQTVVCAVAATGEIYSNDRYVLFWTITGFILVMLVCLAYAVVVRNDFVRRAVQTERTILNPKSDNPTYFDKSVFKKVFPLMLAGVLLMFGISFYTQTLLEITEGIDKSNIALEEIAGRYEESQQSRDIIQNYYNDRFLSKAKLIAFLIEEDPSVLNAESNKYHSYYDKNNSKVFLTDDEGNRLKSVASSARLQELCDANDIESIYVFDEDGHTIGTNTPNWFFTVSHDEEAQSYPFLQILDGKVDSLIQDPMTNDLGEATQFIGVEFTYYTKKGESGNTEYVSRYEYQQAGLEGKVVDGEAGGIMEHHSMVQIGLDAEMTQKLLDSTDVANVLSTNMLNNGFVVMFDTSDDHLCVYSPKEVSIGMTAKELGVSPKAFSADNYYGFARVNGVDYFSCFRYADGYYIGTALLKDEMYHARGIIALITALMSFLLILILSGTVTLTNKEEERLYEAMSEEQAGRGLNSAIFNLILPSGRATTTVKAAARWDNRRIRWSERSPEQKLLVMVSALAGILMLYVILIVMGSDTLFSEGSIIRYILSGDWDRGRNIFAFSSCALVLITIYLGVLLFRIPVRITTSLLGARGETVGHLLLSVVKYGGVLFAIFYCLYLLGIDSSRLLASAGILSLIIGLGAQSLIKDIIAGIFIVFEGEFRVGDIVTIGDYRGNVLDIGLRTTKILGTDGNIKIYNNSDIAGVLNMTQESSIALCYVTIEYGQDIEYVEAVLNRELPKLKDENPLILDGPKYLGVSKLGDSGVELLIICYCSEADIMGMKRFLNRAVLKIFYDNDINIPFPNVTFSTLEMDGRKTLADLLRESSEKEEFPDDFIEE
ncbi:MAG: mechanosensitive ion channel family protein [Mogibacterium sp.]|nr:mechanosensitive ion channel family protein [Mogibacterium sp.]